MTALFSDQSGVYHLPATIEVSEVEQAVQQRNFRFIHLDGQTVANRQELFRLMQTAFELPSHFGNNWDALLDMLRDLSWLPATGYTVFVHNFGPLLANDHTTYDHFINSLSDAAAFWGERMHNQPAMIVLLSEHQ